MLLHMYFFSFYRPFTFSSCFFLGLSKSVLCVSFNSCWHNHSVESSASRKKWSGKKRAKTSNLYGIQSAIRTLEYQRRRKKHKHRAMFGVVLHYFINCWLWHGREGEGEGRGKLWWIWCEVHPAPTVWRQRQKEMPIATISIFCRVYMWMLNGIAA